MLAGHLTEQLDIEDVPNVDANALRLSLGLLAPLAVQRSMRFWCRHLTLVGTVDLATISQSERGPSVGEGLAGFFDLDLG